MNRSLRAMIIAVGALTLSMSGSSWGQNCPGADLNDDCVVDFGDLRVMAGRWLDDSCAAPACIADIDGVAGVDEGDFGGWVNNAAYEYYTIDTTNLVAGDNVIAVEVHQTSATSSDVVFGMALDATVEVTTPPEDPLAEAKLLLESLRITEIMYHPVISSDYEFIELVNVGAEAVNLNGVRIEGGIVFTFGDMTLQPGEYVVAVNNRLVFESFYPAGINIAGEYTGNLSNSGEEIVLALPAPLDAAMLRFDYDDLWRPATDGGGYSLVITDPTLDPAAWDDAESWEAGAVINGSPGSAD